MPNDLSREVRTVALALCDSLTGPRNLEIRKCIEDGRWDDLVKIKIDPRAYVDSESYFADVACVSFLRKYEPLPTTNDRKKVAMDGFYEAERECYRTNQRLLPFVYNTYGVEDEADFEFVLDVRKEVTDILGLKPPANPAGRFGPGATYGDKGSLATIPDKMTSRPTLTREAWPFLVPWAGTLWAQAIASRGVELDFVRGDRFTAVPKDCTKDRGITIQPSINTFYQLAFGSAMRSRLRAVGVNLNTAQDLHRRVARESSISGTYATIDLRQASDLLSSALVKLLIPDQWFTPLDDLRSPTTLVREGKVDKVVVLEKFSAMGNGYTFELETLVFLCVCMAIMRRKGQKPLPGVNVFVFGDDIIVPTEHARDVIAALRFLGFKTNEEKTFLSGPFRESCGGDFFEGVDVRPFFLKELPSEPQHYIAMANGIRRMGLTDTHADIRWDRLRRTWFVALGFIPSDIRRFRGPKDLGDLCIEDDYEFWNSRIRRSIRYIKVYRPATYRKVSWDHFDSNVLLAGACYGLPWGNGDLIPRDSVSGYKQGWVAFS